VNADGDQHMGGVDEDAEGEQGVSLSSSLSLFVSRLGSGRGEAVTGVWGMRVGWGSMGIDGARGEQRLRG
jgi:hypothetical protein